MTIELLDRFMPDLDKLALEAGNATFYHTSTWIESLEAAFPDMLFSCLVAREGASIVGYLPFFEMRKGPFRILQSMPFSTYGGPVFLRGKGIAEALIGSFQSLGSRKLILERSLVDFMNVDVASGFAAQSASTQIVDLKRGFEWVWAHRFDKAKRRQARKAMREGLVVERASTVDEIDRYVDLYLASANAWGARIVYPRKLFHDLLGRGKEKARLFLVRHGEEILGGHLNFYFGDMVIAWNGVTKTGEAGHQAATFLYYTLMKDACEEGFARYNLGASLGKPGLIQYKASLGGVLYRYKVMRKTSALGRLVSALRRWIPQGGGM